VYPESSWSHSLTANRARLGTSEVALRLGFPSETGRVSHMSHELGTMPECSGREKTRRQTAL